MSYLLRKTYFRTSQNSRRKTSIIQFQATLKQMPINIGTLRYVPITFPRSKQLKIVNQANNIQEVKLWH